MQLNHIDYAEFVLCTTMDLSLPICVTVMIFAGSVNRLMQTLAYIDILKYCLMGFRVNIYMLHTCYHCSQLFQEMCFWCFHVYDINGLQYF